MPIRCVYLFNRNLGDNMVLHHSIDGLEDPKKSIKSFESLLATYHDSYINDAQRAFNKLNAFNRKYPSIKAVYKQMQERHITRKKSNGVFCESEYLKYIDPSLIDVYYEDPKNLITNASKDKKVVNAEFSGFVTDIMTFGTWRNTLGVYRIDPDIYDQSIASVIPSDTPTTIFSKLPDWCVYVELPADKPMQIINDCVAVLVSGFWAFFDKMLGEGDVALNIILDMMPSENMPDDTSVNVPVVLLIKEGVSIEESIKGTYSGANTYEPVIQQKMMEQELAQMSKLLSLLLWLCAEEPDISNIHGEPITPEQMRLPKYAVNKKNGAFIPPNGTTIFEIGKRLGGEVRDFSDKVESGEGRIPSRKRPHIRKGHWHGVWKGTGQNKHFDLYWQPAIFVNTKLNQ